MKTGNVVFGTRRSSTRFPKFVKEVAAMYHELRKAGTSYARLNRGSVISSLIFSQTSTTSMSKVTSSGLPPV